ncbi:restriction endonuclease subunit S [Vibrio caribbeanicus]|uniref:restriction endonuclease subunit S n=1 Tax=Vibrio caribbeanicus TaxID=701175 RepID=UPI002284C38B|nr:restriction endonuclease subunit S [Vibrio caribbeanicus]MCY9844560.1 restriction endonuclease subunit S [Vibrio caribbeanicus]
MSWPLVELGNICSRVSVGHVGKTSEYYTDNSGIPFLRTQNVSKTGLELSDIKYVTSNFHSRLKKSQLVEGDVILSRVISSQINCAVIPPNFGEANCANIILARPTKELLDSKFLYYYLKSEFTQRELLKNQVGSAQSVVNTSVFKSWKIPLPPLEEQKRIAAILDKADAIRQKRKQAIDLADEFLRSVFLDMFGDPVTNPKGWEEHALKDITDVRSGVAKGKKVSLDDSVTLPYMRVANVQDGYLDLSEIKQIVVSKKDAEKCQLIKGDVLLTEGGDPDKLGRGYVWNNEIENCIHQNHIFSVRIENHHFVHPHFLSAQISSQRGKLYFLKVGKQTTGIATINKTVLRDFVVFIPPLELQKKYVAIKNKVDNFKRKCESDDLKLFRSIRHKVFSG